MLKKIQRYFDSRLSTGSQQDAAAVEHAHQLACCALMIELIKIDHQVSEAEQKAVYKAMMNVLSIDESELQELIQLAEEESHNSTSLYQFTERGRRAALDSTERKLHLF